jgi:hypothetical protein
MATLLLVTGCGSIEYNSTNSPKMVVVVERTPFFHNGPAQGNGPDLSLVKGDEVEVLRKELGYSFVRIFDGQNGYVANEALKPVETAAPQALAKPTPAAAPTSTNAPAKPSFRY